MRWDDVLALVETGQLQEAVGRACERRRETPPAHLNVDYVRYKHGTSCLLGLGTGQAFPCDFGYVKLFEAGDARTCVEKYQPRAGDQGWVEELRELRAALFRFPLDRTVPGLGVVSDMGRLKHVLHSSVPGWSPGSTRIRARKSTLAMLKYKPERRGLAVADLELRNDPDGDSERRTAVVQAYADDSGARVQRVLMHLALWTAGGPADRGLRVPLPLGYEAERRILSQEWVPGTEWGEQVGSTDFERGCGAAARALAELRRVPPPGGLPADCPFESAGAVLRDLAELGEPGVAPAARELLHEVTRRPSGISRLDRVLCHGDFHYHQLLIDSRTGWATLIDWDECRVGDPREDPGNLLAHFHLLELDGRVTASEGERLRGLFLEESGTMPDLAPFVALHLIKLAFVPFRNLRPDWRASTARLLERAGAILASAELKT